MRTRAYTERVEIGTRELRANLAGAVRRAAAGERVVITVDGHPVACRQGPVLVTAFHPELTEDLRLHQRFVDLVADRS